MAAVIDAAQDVRPHLSCLIQHGITSIIRYDSRHGHWKEASPGEIKAILAHGLRVGIVNEDVGNVAGAFNDPSGYADAAYSLARAAERGQPEHSAIYYAVDFDASYSEIHDHVVPYFRGVMRAHLENNKTWYVGVYSSGLCAATLEQNKLITPGMTWITCSGGFQGSRAYVAAGREALWQYACERTLCGLDVDFNLSPTGKWGWWANPMAAMTTLLSSPLSDWPPEWGRQVGKASWYNDGQNADGTPVLHGDLTAASRRIPFHSRVRVTRLDTDASVIVTIHDRGPYVKDRIIDLRPAAAEALEMKDAGVAPVKLEKI